MRKINEIIIHCTDTKPLHTICIDDVRRWHISRGFDDVGYHYLIKLDGSLEFGRSIEKIGAHCKGHNRYSVGICFVGGRDFNNDICDTRTSLQKRSLDALIKNLCNEFPIKRIVGHNFYNKNKKCPCFDAALEYQSFIHLNS